jgi:hypothetical protein
MSQRTDLAAREEEVIRILKVLSIKNDDFVVIGGYAINALTAHRFSVDCDIVTGSSGLRDLGKILGVEGYSIPKIGKQSRYGAKMKKYTKSLGMGKVSVEVFPKEVTCRQTDGAWDFDLIKANSSWLRIVGLTDSARALVPKKELLIAMKIHSGRNTDLRDVVMLSERADWSAVKEFAACGNIKKVKKQIDSAIKKIGKDEFASSLKAEFGLRQDVLPVIRRSLAGLQRVRRSFA